ncbi:GNAT family N-acetyltransferase [Nocardioides seonyuensis]|uniref:GNAT family N-acetyltransferase n=1 Tax=Nocardioides seonyuensis TaxID=2518371 RepID=A0A4P7IE51_9ACTN|nr:GNAT family N-acetyltransferase [Nocardioides seonyuensis]QBX55494.1 GNAT family N-acetyltransferase [Nocardioides seonyuensis]
MELPPGLATRPVRLEDAPAVHAIIAAQERYDIGVPQVEEADLVADWTRPSHDLAARSVCVLEGDRIVAYAELMGADRADAAVHPQWRGRGIGTWLAAWLRAKGREVGSTVVGMPVPQGSAGDRLLEGLGYHVRWTSWLLQLPAGVDVPERRLPPGYAVGTATESQQAEAHAVVEDAFLEWSVRERESFEDFRASVLQRPGFEPWNLRVVTGPGDDVVAAAVVLLGEDAGAGRVGYVSRLATRRDQRNQGLAQALLVDSFAAARAAGAVVSELATDSRTGALGLYEKVGMVTTSVWVNRAVNLGQPV